MPDRAGRQRDLQVDIFPGLMADGARAEPRHDADQGHAIGFLRDGPAGAARRCRGGGCRHCDRSRSCRRPRRKSTTGFRSWRTGAGAISNIISNRIRTASDQPQQQQQRQAPVDSARAPATASAPIRRRTDAQSWCSATRWPSGSPMGWRMRLPRRRRSALCASTRPDFGADPRRAQVYDWPAAARDMLTAEKPDYIVMMIGSPTGAASARRSAHRARPPARSRRQGLAPSPDQAAAPPDAGAKPADAEAPPPDPARDTAQDDEQPISSHPKARSPERWCTNSAPRSGANSTPAHRRDDRRAQGAERAGVLGRAAVDPRLARDIRDGLPQRSLPRTRREGRHDLHRHLGRVRRRRRELTTTTGRTSKARRGVFVQATACTSRRAGARKLAHYVEREISRVMLARAAPVATPLPEPEPEAKAPPAAVAPGLPPRPIASPVMSLTAPKSSGDTLLGVRRRRAMRRRIQSRPACW